MVCKLPIHNMLIHLFMFAAARSVSAALERTSVHVCVVFSLADANVDPYVRFFQLKHYMFWLTRTLGRATSCSGTVVSDMVH